MLDEIELIQGVLASLPPSYENVIKEYVLAGNPQYFLEFMKWLKTKQILHTDVEGAGSNEIEVIDVTGICDIQRYKCCMLFYGFEYMILILCFCENRGNRGQHDGWRTLSADGDKELTPTTLLYY